MKIVKKDCAKGLSNNALLVYLVTELRKKYDVEKLEQGGTRYDDITGRDFLFLDKDSKQRVYHLLAISHGKKYNVSKIYILNVDHNEKIVNNLTKNETLVTINNQNTKDEHFIVGDFNLIPEEIKNILLNKFYNTEESE